MRFYPGKILLFGEYVLLLGAPGLAMPVHSFFGEWVNDESLPFGADLLAFAGCEQITSSPEIDHAALQKAVQEGLRFKSSIPQGYGMGSSGALIAAVYDRFARNKTDDITRLRSILGTMEGHFHGQSSGLDPLTSYLQKPLLVSSTNSISLPQLDEWKAEEEPVFFLIDTRQARQTAPLVSRFMELTRQKPFLTSIEKHWLPASTQTMNAWMGADPTLFWSGIQALSEAQFNLVPHLIPDFLKKTWKKTLSEENVSLKICGAGGGGFILGFCRPSIEPEALLGDLPIIIPSLSDV